MKHMTVLALAILAMFGSPGEGRAATRLLWRTPPSGVTVVYNATGPLVPLGQVDVSTYDRIRIVAVARRPALVPLPEGFGSPFRVELHIAEGSSDLGPLENGIFALNPSSTNDLAPAHTEISTGLFVLPVVTTLVVEALGPTTYPSQPTVVDIYLYGQVP